MGGGTVNVVYAKGSSLLGSPFSTGGIGWRIILLPFGGMENDDGGKRFVVALANW
jgi:hypothetical protein